MPEGPSLVILHELLQPFIGKKVIHTKGNAKIDLHSLEGKKLLDIRTWGKQMFLCFKGSIIRIHFLLFGSYSIGEQTKPARSLRLGMIFSKQAVYFYTCSVKIVEDDLESLYDWEADVMSDKWKPLKARKKLNSLPDTMVCDALLNQEVFSGVGNIIKNEVLYRIKLHPETLIKNIPKKKVAALIREAKNYSFDFLKWKKEFTLKKHWLAHTKKTCLRCDLPIIKKYCGKTHRRTFYCENCQIKYP